MVLVDMRLQTRTRPVTTIPHSLPSRLAITAAETCPKEMIMMMNARVLARPNT